MNAYLSGGTEQVKKTIRSDYIDCNIWNFVFWFPMDIIMFACVPVPWQLLVVRATDLIFLPVDSFFSNRSVPKPHKAVEKVLPAEIDSDSDSDQEFDGQLIKPRADTLCCTIL
eukprot:TRINITY_DN31376_c0_g1_i1.p1 TRINITY_DN31376_c0_g1~~TRINITY_DN31376_c0_g1_i1.p1  ORF type:complete len:113 (+),score=8.91 TRINITY_DN31376_c0_g1_i1:3-341(+)